YINQWLQADNTQRHLAIFGEYGAGKSSLSQKLTHDLAAAFLADPNASRIPILLNLRDFIGKLDIEAYITSFLDRECRVTNPKIDLFRKMNDAGIFLLIFDGFDEMAVKVDADTLESNLLEIEKLAAAPNSKAILTSRPEYFISAGEEREAITPAVNPFLNRKIKYEPLRILPWQPKQIELFLRKRVPLIEGAKQPWTFYRDGINKTGSLSDLSQRPVLLDMIVKSLPILIASDTPINLPNLYRMYLINEIKRQKVLKRRQLLISEEDRLSLLQLLAADIYTNTIPDITFESARNYVERKISPPKHELEAHTRDFLTNSFLIRRGDQYHFSHKSIWEYLVAAQLNGEIKSGFSNTFGLEFIEPAILNFMKEFELNLKTLWLWFYLTRDETYQPHKQLYLGGNAATLLCALFQDALAGKDLSGTNLFGADLSKADLRGTNLEGAYLGSVELPEAKYYRETLPSAQISSITISIYFVT